MATLVPSLFTFCVADINCCFALHVHKLLHEASEICLELVLVEFVTPYFVRAWTQRCRNQGLPLPSPIVDCQEGELKILSQDLTFFLDCDL